MYPLIDSQGKILLQASLDAAIAAGEVLDLEGKAWPFFDSVTVVGDPRIRNGSLIPYRPVPYPDPDPVTGLVEEWVAIQINGTPELVDLELYRGGGPGVIGMDILDAVDFVSDRCRWDRFRSGGGVGLRLSGVQGARISTPGFWENDSHLECRMSSGIRQCTDIRLLMPRVQTAICGNNAHGIALHDVANFGIWGGTIENARDGNLIYASGCKGLDINSRFETVGQLSPGTYSHIYLANSCELSSFNNCSFDNTVPDANGVYMPIIGSDGTDTLTTIRNGRFPQDSPTVRGDSQAVDVGSKNFSGDKLAGLRKILE